MENKHSSANTKHLAVLSEATKSRVCLTNLEISKKRNFGFPLFALLPFKTFWLFSSYSVQSQKLTIYLQF